MHVLVLCNDFPPLNSVGGQRPASWSHYWPDLGIRTSVVTKNWLPDCTDAFGQRTWPHPSEESPRDGLRLHRVPQRNLPSERLAQAVGPKRLVLLRKLLTGIEHTGAFHLEALDRHSNILARARKVIENEKVDLIVATGEPFVLFRHACRLSQESGVPWVADFRDGWSVNHVAALDRRLGRRVMMVLERSQERRLLRSAALVTTVDPWLAERISKLHGVNVETVYNGFWKILTPLPEEEWEPTTVVTHAGTLAPGQNVEVFLEAIRRMAERSEISRDSLRIDFLGLNFFPEQAKRVQDFHPTVTPFLRLTNRLPLEESWERLRRSDILLSPIDPGYQAIYAKTYDYLASGRPILVAPDDDSILARLVLKVGAGAVAQDAAAIESLMRQWLHQKASRGHIPSTAGDATLRNEFSRQNQAARFASLLRGVLSSGRSD